MCYIGQTKAGFKNRWRTHAKRAVKAEDGTSNRLYQDMWENGLENYTFQIIEICEKDRLTEREKFYIDFFNSKEWGFNSKT
jgi:group I intron endonuclease